ncbi:MAG: HAMP domain-containing protein [Ardenticatenaceae bacterium]|nr:HAMP domain-containing protein [Ardenticatenaceae bacterium]
MRSLSSKLVIAFLLVSLIGTILGAIFAGLTTSRQFTQFMLDQALNGLRDNLADYYAANGSWEGVNTVFRYSRFSRSDRSGDMVDLAAPLLIDVTGQVVFNGTSHRSTKFVSSRELERALPIEVDAQVVGWLLPTEDINRRLPASAEASFLQRVNQALFLGALGATAVALLIGIILARTLSRPIRELTGATRALAAGNLDQTVPVRSADELGELAASFNQMSADLTHASQLRRQMTADIAHDLRTPLSVILGYTEALSEGKLPGSPDVYTVMHREAQHLNHLVDDLRTLSLADAGELPLTRRAVAPDDLLQRTLLAYSPQAECQSVALRLEMAPGLPILLVDPERMAQVLNNLVSNALRYTPSGGTITLAAASTPDHQVQITVSDTGSGIDPLDLPHIFDRFYRGEKSRAQQEGESGLGLAIAKSLVEAHGGSIYATSEPGHGTIFTLTLPIPEEISPAVADHHE